MTATLTPTRGSNAAGGGPRRDPEQASRRDEWLAGWRVALRLAARDAWTHPGRSALVLVMIALPVLLMVAALTVYATKDLDDREAEQVHFGAGQGVVTTVTSEALEPDPRGQTGYSCGGPGPCARQPATPLPGLPAPAAVEAARSADLETAVGRLLGAHLVTVASYTTQVRVGEETRPVQTLAIDGREPVTRGKADLVSGRWPASADEVVVTEAGLAKGLPATGTITVTEQATDAPQQGGRERVLQVVGVGVGRLYDPPAEAELIRLPDRTGTGWQGALVDRATPLTWAEVQAASRHGVALTSRQVLRDPPPVTDGIGRGATGSGASGTQTLTLVALLAAALLVESTLLAGPAFAVIAQRQRRTLALAAANGATRAQLRRTVLGQAVVLGGVSSAVAAVLGVAAGAVGVWGYRRWSPTALFGPFDVPWAAVAIVVGCAVVAAVVAALLPARGLAQLDVVSALRGQVAPRRMRRSVPVVGLVLAAAGAVGVFAVVAYLWAHPGAETWIAILLILTVVALVVGALMAVPAIVALVGRLGGHLPVAARMATRDAARQRGRATPTVAAIMAGSILLGAMTIGFASVAERQRLDYRPHAPDGWLWSHVADRATPDLIRAAIPGAVVHAEARAEGPDSAPVDAPPTWRPPAISRALVATVPGCSPTDLLGGDRVDACPSLGIGFWGPGGQVLALDDAALRDLVQVTAEQRSVLDRGGVLVSDARLATTGTITWVTGGLKEAEGPTAGAWVGDSARRQTPVSALTHEQSGRLGVEAFSGRGVMTTAGVQGLGAVVRQGALVAHGPGGEAVTQEQRDAVVKAMVGTVMPEASMFDGALEVERGYTDQYAKLAWLMLGTVTLLILVATTTATALSMGEAQRDLDTLAAIGSTGRLRRGIAAAQAATLALIGTALGLAVGAAPGIAFSREATRGAVPGGTEPVTTLVLPWGVWAVAVLAIPALAALLAALVVRSNPVLTRRTT
ncbi:FtsX-like permease family protein [Arsenicicoccus sp. oral taxon 190]|uniref:FtsX-like permease family protein n=1 Tax=Arsenicicoccus sp. oral taxon 190 TaxID=1658671 RepID=UPI000679F8BB|nr:FtsX-like permease family protein [Arsenicicoccus sp. oral taxon 190]AKT51093.1 hypothetical protein ADJ73_06760 [Arsenicicoccus sp. oral taxon 190]